MHQRFLGPLLIALIAVATVALTLAPEGSGPGVTCDEQYHADRGKQLVTALRQQGLAFFLPANIDRNFYWRPGNPPVQAPLGYWLLGGIHYLFDPAPDNPNVLSITAARFAPALAFALLILMVGCWTTRHEGQLAGMVASAAVFLMPRLFAHAHLAALDMLTTLFFVAAVLAVAEAARDGRTWCFALAGAVWGAAILVRLHGLLAAPPIVLWLLWRFRKKSVLPVLAWVTTGAITVFAGWPWLWLAPLTHFRQFLSSGTGRDSIHVFYAGQVWADRDVPWHYPWIMFAVTIPLGLLVLGIAGLWAKSREKSPSNNPLAPDFSGSLLLGTMFFVLFVFSWPGTPVYDGERLFLMVFPLWAIWVGIGAKWFLEKSLATRLPSRLRYGILFAFLAIQATGLIVYHPCHLSYYNYLVGGLPGAERLGFEITYWGDTVREPMLAEAMQLSGETSLALAPSLAPFQIEGIRISSPAIHDKTIPLPILGWDPNDQAGYKGFRYAVIYHRRADLAAAEWLLKNGRVVSQYENQGVWLAKLVKLDGF